MRKLLIPIFLIFCASNKFYSQIRVYQFEEIDGLQKKEKRNVVVFIHTDWCKYCKSMMNTTLKNEHIIKQLNDNFYFIELNAEEKNDIYFFGRKFKFKPTGNNTGMNELAEQLGTIDGKISFPQITILNPAYEIIFQYPQFINSSDLLNILNKLK